MNSRTGKRINILVSTVLLIVFLYLAFRNVKFGELAEILKNTNYLYVVIGITIGVVGGTIVRSLRWGILLEPIKPKIPFMSLFSPTIVGYMVNNVIPRSGEFIRPYLIGKNIGISKTSAFATIILERVLDTVSFLLMIPLCLIYFKSRITNAFPDIGSAVVVLAVVIFLILFWVFFMMFRTEQSLKVIQFFTKFLPKKIHDRVENLFEKLVRGFVSFRKPQLLLKIAFYTALLWLVYLMSTFIPFFSFGIFTDGSMGAKEVLWNANLLLVMINISMFIPSPANTGPYHYVCKVTLVSIFTIQQATALSYATATHLMSFLLYSLTGLIFFLKYHYKISELKEGTINT